MLLASLAAIGAPLEAPPNRLLIHQAKSVGSHPNSSIGVAAKLTSDPVLDIATADYAAAGSIISQSRPAASNGCVPTLNGNPLGVGDSSISERYYTVVECAGRYVAAC